MTVMPTRSKGVSPCPARCSTQALVKCGAGRALVGTLFFATYYMKINGIADSEGEEVARISAREHGSDCLQAW